jgi:periplasmic protein TonB
MEFDDDEPEQPPQSFLRRYRIAITVTGVVIAGIIAFAKLISGGGGPSRHESVVMVNLPPPPPPPQITPPPPPPPEQEKTEQPMIKEQQPKEVEAKPKDQAPLGTGIKGNGPDSFGLSGKEGNGRIGGDSGGGTKWSWYAREVQVQVQQALQENRKTRSASLAVNVRIWPNPAGRITRAQIAGSTGDPMLDEALSEALTGLQLPDPPPSDMPSPITLRVTERRPH